MSEYHSAYSNAEEQYLPEYSNREDGRELVRELIEDLVRNRLEEGIDQENLLKTIPDWCATHPIALLENEFEIEIKQHDELISIDR
ncbi:MAG: hypothetical protein ABEJ65_05990 [bacterium]